MRIGEAKAGHDPSKPDCRLQQDAAAQRHAACAAEESAAERIGGVAVDQGVDQPRDIGRSMLSIGIERHNVVGPLRQREFDTGLERGALPQIDRMRDNIGAGRERNLPRRVMRAVVNDNHAIALTHEVRNDRADDCGLVKSRNDDPNRLFIEFFTVF